MTWATPFQVNDPANSFDPDPGVPTIHNGPPPTTWIGEYFGIALFGGTVYLAWNGNSCWKPYKHISKATPSRVY